MTTVHPVFGTPVPADWQVTSVDELKSPEPSACVAGPFGSNISSKYFVPEGVPVIRGSNLTDDLTKFVADHFVFVSSERALSYRPQLVKDGDLVFTCWGTIGQVGLIPDGGPYDEYIISNKQLKLRPDASLSDSRFLFYYFASPAMVGHIRNRAIGSAVPGINLGILKSLPVVLPPLPTQHKIADILTAYDELIENNNRRIKLLEEMAQRIYREWFVDFRYPGHESVPLVDSELGPIPESWETARLGSVAENFDRKRKPLSGIVRALRPGPYPYYGAARIFDYIDDYIFDGTYLLMAEDGSVITPSGVAVLQYVSGRFWANNHTHILRGTRLSTEHLYLLLADIPISGYITGAAQPKITQANLNRIPCVVPRNDVAAAFNAIVLPVFRERQLLHSQVGTLRAMRNLLLPRLMSGEIDVTDLDIAMPEAAA